MKMWNLQAAKLIDIIRMAQISIVTVIQLISLYQGPFHCTGRELRFSIGE